jgi:hypothetical protein
MLTLLSMMLDYKNERVLKRYATDYPNNSFSPEEAFRELMKFFWLSLKHDVDKKRCPNNKSIHFIFGIHAEMKEIDDMWHTFLLFTKDYMFFCRKYIGKYFHHSPTEESERQSVEAFIADFKLFVSYVYDHLGEESCLRWFGGMEKQSALA